MSVRMNERKMRIRLLDLNLTQTEVGRKAGLHYATVHRVVHGAKVSQEAAEKVAVVLGIAVDEYMAEPAGGCLA